MNSKKIYLTKEGLNDLKNELNEFTNSRRPEILERLSNARDQGDLSENAEYTSAKDELSFIDGRIDEIEEILKQAQLITGSGSNKKSVDLGSTVIVKIGGKKEEFTVVGEWEANPTEKKISHESPLGKALLGKRVGESLEIDAPAGKIKYTIVSIK